MPPRPDERLPRPGPAATPAGPCWPARCSPQSTPEAGSPGLAFAGDRCTTAPEQAGMPGPRDTSWPDFASRPWQSPIRREFIAEDFPVDLHGLLVLLAGRQTSGLIQPWALFADDLHVLDFGDCRIA